VARGREIAIPDGTSDTVYGVAVFHVSLELRGKPDRALATQFQRGAAGAPAPTAPLLVRKRTFLTEVLGVISLENVRFRAPSDTPRRPETVSFYAPDLPGRMLEHLPDRPR
jgi:hypothetical protein